MQFFSEVIDSKVEKLIQAAMDGNLSLVRELIKSGANVNGVNPNYGDTALSQAAFKGHSEVVDFLLTQQPSVYSKNLGLILACQTGQIDIVKKLLNQGADVNFYIEDYHTALFQVIVKNRMDIFEIILKTNDFNVNFEDKLGVIPLHLAAFNGCFEMVKQLIDKGADPTKENKDGWAAEAMANKKGYSEIASYIQSKKTEMSCS